MMLQRSELSEVIEACADESVDVQLRQLAVKQNTEVADNIGGAYDNRVYRQRSIS